MPKRFKIPEGIVKFPAFPVERFCLCGERFKYVLATKSALKEFEQTWKRKHKGPDHETITRAEWEMQQRHRKSEAEGRAKEQEGWFPFMAEGKKGEQAK